MSIDKQILEILACPACKTKVVLAGEYIQCTKCQRRYPIRDDIPIMLLSEAVTGEDEPSPQDGVETE